MEIQHFYDEPTGTLSYAVFDRATRDAVLIDPVLDYDPAAGRTSLAPAERIGAFLEAEGLRLHYVLETHVHADHLTSSQYFRDRFGAEVVVGAEVPIVQRTFKELLDLGADFAVDGSQFDVLMPAGSVLEAGSLRIEAIATSGHTPASLSYSIGDAVFVGDTLFQPDSGTARCDFPGGSAAELYDSIQRLYALPDDTRVFTLHDYMPGGRELAFCSTIAEQKAANVHLDGRTTKDEFVALREELEAGKPVPRLLFPSVQVNLRAGRFPAPAANGTSFLKIPLNLL